MTDSRITVLKVGGSLLDMPDLRDRLAECIAKIHSDRTILFPGGGSTANVVRDLDRTHQLGEEASHWLAIWSLSLNAQFLSLLLDAPVVEDVIASLPLGIVDPLPWAMLDENDPDHCPHHWDVTSDSLALRFAQSVRAHRLFLLKSVSLPDDMTWKDAAAQGFVDPFFPTLASRTPHLDIRWINLRRPVETIEATR